MNSLSVNPIDGNHPNYELLTQYNHATLSTGLSVAISAHLELCASCRHVSRQLENDLADAWMNQGNAQSDSNTENTDSTGIAGITGITESALDSIISQIVATPQAPTLNKPSNTVTEMHMLDHSVAIPRVLAKSAQQGLVWKKLPGGINQARVVLDKDTQCDFIYMKPGGQIPPHRHLGSEITLVLDGYFRDDIGDYGPADFLLRDASHTHSPISDEGCLCFAVLDSPLKFTSGFARLLNPISQLLFNRV